MTSRRWTVRLDRARTDGCWLLDQEHEHRDLGLPDLLLLRLLLIGARIPHTVTRDRQEVTA